ncbi:MAG: hypothetical protein J6S12_02015 [Alphaproteobacteria bacterium]|nr:hypothetical protein [Alphaproteobacteria bacterium]
MTSAKTKETKEVEFLNVENFQILKATEGKGGVCYFDAVINGLTIYGMKVVPLKDGSGDFVAFPAQKGADGKYYKIVWARFRPETEKSILDAVQAELDK